MDNKSLLKKNERIDQLFSEDVEIIQSAEVFSFSIDAVLLANFAEIKKSQSANIVDLCAGNGAVGLFVSRRTKGHISMVEIQPRLADMAERSVKLNHLEKQISVFNQDLNDSEKVIAPDSIDAVLCNPPYFKVSEKSIKNPNSYLAIARHEIKTDLENVLTVSSRLLKMNGKLFLVHRPDRLGEILNMMEKTRLSPKRIQFAYGHDGEEANVVLIEAIKDGKSGGVRIMPPIIEYEGSEYSEEMKAMLYGNPS